ncbi:MAG: threonylcarbamoyladenosine tRNA methylthiotransferase MtaB [Aliidongia sp.]|jgi:threonylcarbamoyladenosine tRNA methylthiotransferase MtaB|nr:threonylcarbamoyladenosine tRNA methylthiotransferase MtaB [Aliidongia sp.]
MAGLDVLSFGCRLNLYESEVMRGLAQRAGLDDAIIVNTCAVTAEAERQGRQAIRRAHRERPGAQIIVTGCAAQLHPETFAAMPEVARVLGNGDKLKPENWISGERVVVGDVMTLAETASHLLDGFAENTRGFLQMQQGCDHRCTFCIIPLARGNNRSVPLGELVAAARHLLAHGHREIVLTGVDLTGYGADLPGKPRLGQALRRLLALLPDLPRLRLSSLDPAEIDEDLWHLIATEPRLMPHLHFSAQSGDDLILKRMKRRHLCADIVRAAERARALRSDIVLGADLIAGFPTETEAQFERSLDLIETANLIWLHVFPYSPRPGTPAARMPQVPGSAIKARAARLRAAGQAAAQHFLEAQIGRRLDILMERGGTGRTAHYAPVRPDRPVEAGTLVPVTITGLENSILRGEIG